jgi:uracil-DNA glycosylase
MPIRINIPKLFAGVDKKWIKVFTSPSLMPHLKTALTALEKESSMEVITPHPYNMFNFARNTPYDSVTTVIIGQDPYPKQGDADGMCFSSKSAKTPASLRNIYKCLMHTGEIKTMPSTSNLSNWASQGVLMMNAALTTRVGEPNAHKNIWKEFTDKLITHISHDDTCGPCWSLTFMLWGNLAKKKREFINEDCVIHEWIHPSPLAQNIKDEKKKFLYCDHFSMVNTCLEDEQGLPRIDWNPAPRHVAYTDGACAGNGKGIFARAGYACYFAKGTYASTVKYGKIAPAIVGTDMVYGTNQRGEGLGIVTALETVLEKKGTADLTIVTDSKFWIEMVETYMPNWERKGTDFKSKKNSDITIKLHDLVKRFEDVGTLELIHVASHDKDPSAPRDHVAGNRIADKYACMAKKLINYEQVVEQVE